MKIALYALFGTGSSLHEADAWREGDEDYVRLTDIVEVDFIDRPQEKVIPEKVARIDRGIEGLRAELGEKISKLEDEKAKLLAITHES